MKTLLTIIILISCSVSQGISQSITIQSIEAGPKAGLNISSWGGDDFGTKSMNGIHIGAFALLKFSDRLSLQPELFYSAQGTQSQSGRVKIAVNYLNVPVLAKIDVYKGVYVNIGPQIAFLLSATDGDDLSAEDEFKGSDLSIAIGAGYVLPIGLHFQLRYNAGISNINAAGFDENTSSQVIQISAAYVVWKK